MTHDDDVDACGEWRVETPQLTIERAQDHDVAELCALFNDPRLEYNPGPPSTPEMVLGFIHQTRYNPRWVLRTPDGRVVGLLHLRFHTLQLFMELYTIHVHPDEQDNGYATLALRECLAHFSENWEIEARILPSNHKMQHVAAEVGMREMPKWDDKGYTFWSYEVPRA